jgi:hypothetical protein
MAQASDALPEATNVRRVILWLNMPGPPGRHRGAALIILRFPLMQ